MVRACRGDLLWPTRLRDPLCRHAERFPAELHNLLLDDPPDARSFVGGYSSGTKTSTAIGDGLVPFAEQLRRRTWSDMAAEFVRAMTEVEPPATLPDMRTTT